MRAIQVKEYLKGPQELTVSSLPDPVPSSNEYLIAVHAAATNFFDLLQIRGKYQSQPPLPWISGFEFAGVILSTPSASLSPRYQVGERVFGGAQGSYATRICAAEASMHPIPAGWSFVDAAGLMVTAPTSYLALVTRAEVRKGDYVLVHAAAGGVGLAAVQIAKAFGAVVIATAGSSEKLKIAASFGADHGVNYREQGWEEAVRKLTPGGRGVDVVYDSVGMVNSSLKCTALKGRILIVGFAAGTIEKVPMNRVLLKMVSLVGVYWGRYQKDDPAGAAEVWRALFGLMTERRFKSTVYADRKFVGLESVGEALELLERRETWGKVIIAVPQDGQSKL